MNGINLRRRAAQCCVALSIMWAGAASASNNTVAGSITSYATYECAGFEWRITGDDNNNCVVTTEYRLLGQSTWKAAQPLWRVEAGLWRHGEDPGNLLAGSLFSLTPGTTYEARLTLNDPDGGTAQSIVQVTTRTEPKPDPAGRVRYVSPGSGGGTGTVLDPFKGLAAADVSAQPGDVFIVTAGLYTSRFVPTRDGSPTRPISYVGASPGVVILDGNGGTSSVSNCIDLSRRKHVIIENMTLRNCLRPVVVHNTVGVVIRGCTIEPLRQPLTIIAIYGDSLRDLLVADNTIQMTGAWATLGRTGAYGTGGYGVKVGGDGIVICYNKVIEAWDGFNIGLQNGTGLRTFNSDIYNNVVDRASDDASQTDAVHANIRIFRNRFLNSGSPVSFQPAFGGPCYVMFNEMYNVRIDPYKYHQETFYFGAADPQETSGMLAFHNTSVCSKAGWYEGGLWHHVKHRNNLLVGARTAMYSLYIPGGQRGDLDYNGYNRQQSNMVKYNGTAYGTLPAFGSGAGQESRGVEIDASAFVRAPYPDHPEWDWAQGYGLASAPLDFDLQLSANSPARDKGQVLANINDAFTGGAPDLGCYEAGKSVPWYGPRPSAIVDVPEVPSARTIGLRLSPPSPNPAPGAISFTVDGEGAASVSVRIVDIAGRHVRSLRTPAALARGAHVLGWDGYDDRGTLVREGLYLVLLESDGVMQSRKVAILR
ncbi:MAG: FlgD immunoglobulin-like domain containing protein [Candidatus Eisenbacteria bacterium]